MKMQKKWTVFAEVFVPRINREANWLQTKRICALVGKYEGSERESGSGNFFLREILLVKLGVAARFSYRV